MTYKKITFCLFFVFPILLISQNLLANNLKRVALVVGSHRGNETREILRYAGEDAKAIAIVLSELGGSDKEDIHLLVDPSKKELQDHFIMIDSQIRQKAAIYRRTEFIFYYSGHSDEDGLMLGHEKLFYGHLREMIKSISSKVKIAILDSCASGALIKLKGGSRMQPFMVDESSDSEGYAFITSSSDKESAQESSKIGGSFFTHYLVSALRGAADANDNQTVTLNEAYHYAFQETLARTHHSLYGAQHAGYDFHLRGAGDLVLTDLRRPQSGIRFAKNLLGRLYIYDERGNLDLELNKKESKQRTIALRKGKYTINYHRDTDKDGAIYQQVVTLKDGKILDLDQDHFYRLRKTQWGIGNKSKGFSPKEPALGVTPLISHPWGDHAGLIGEGYGVELTFTKPIYRQSVLGSFLADFDTRAFLGWFGNQSNEAQIFFFGVGLSYQGISFYGISSGPYAGLGSGGGQLTLTEDTLSFFQGLAFLGYEFHYPLSGRTEITAGLGAKYFIDPKVHFGIFDLSVGLRYRL